MTVRGVDVHPGQATGKLVNALRLAAQIVAALPSDHADARDDRGSRGLHPPVRADRDAGAGARSGSIVRDFDDELLERHVALLEQTAQARSSAPSRAPGSSLDVREQYRNMRRVPEPRCRTWPTPPKRRSAAEGIEPIRTPIRGGTDGSRLSEMGLPTPNIFTGGHEYHSVREWASRAGHGGRGGDGRAPRRGVGAERRCRLAPPGSLASLDGEIMLAAEATIPATDEGLIRGDGVFEVIRLQTVSRSRSTRHLARLERSAANLRLPLDLEAVRADAYRLLAHAGAGFRR